MTKKESQPKKNKPYEPKEIEEKVYKKWEKAKAFMPAKTKKRGQKSFSIVITDPSPTEY